MKTVTVTCDGCGHDLSTRWNSVDYRLVLQSEAKPGYGPGVYADMYIADPLPGAHHFCALECLDKWRKRELFEDGLWREFNEAWMSQNGSRMSNGLYACTPMPDDLRKTKADEFKAVALLAVPMKGRAP